ncbi:MAG: hypothetical protein N2572_04995 [Syntrophales bacterium]|nr:hypothetical protein [Syntrophales bacterium]
MVERSRIKYNPVTREIEIEGSEEFIREYFDRVQELVKREVPEVKERKRVRKTSKTAARGSGRKPRKEKAAASTKGVKAKVMDLITKAGAEGISSIALQEKTGLSARQIWSVIYRAEKAGKIVKEKRGVYRLA